MSFLNAQSYGISTITQGICLSLSALMAFAVLESQGTMPTARTPDHPRIWLGPLNTLQALLAASSSPVNLPG